VNNYGMSQNPDTKVYILVFSNEYFNYYCKKCGNKYKNRGDKCDKWCNLGQLKNDFTSGNLKIDNFIQEKLEWIPYNKLIIVEELGDNCLTTAVWKDGPLYYNGIEYRKELCKEVCLRYLHNSQDINDEFLIEVLEFISIDLNEIILI
jgi:hypothetical protein